jgi:hypothetical protein
MQHIDFAITVGAGQAAGYPVAATAQGLGRVTGILPSADPGLSALLNRALSCPPGDPGAQDDATTAAGAALFSWLLAEPLETQLRLAWDRAERLGQGLRLRLSIDAPEIAALPWEMLYDPRRDHFFATEATTPLMRYLDQTGFFGALADQEAELPLHMLLVLPNASDLDLAGERQVIEDALRPLGDAVDLHVLEGIITRTTVSDALMALPYDIVHMTGHAAFNEGQSYVGLNRPDGSPDWVDSRTITRLVAHHRTVKLAVLNACSTGQVDEAAGFRGLAPQLVRAGVPAVAAMQYPLADAAALTFAREFYRRLCTGDDPGQVDAAMAHARNMLAVVHPEGSAFCAPVLYTHASDGAIFTLPHEPAIKAVLAPSTDSAKLAMFVSSLQSSMEFDDDWALAGPADIAAWRDTLRWAERAYHMHLGSPHPADQQAARHGLALVQARLASLEK